MPAEQTSLDTLLREGVAAAKAGRKSEAQSKLREVVARDDRSEQGWLWLASAVDSDEERRVCLSNVVVINPNHAKAKAELNALERRAAFSNINMPRPNRDMRVLLLLGGSGVLAFVLIVVLVVSLSKQAPAIAAMPTVAAVDTATELPTGDVPISTSVAAPVEPLAVAQAGSPTVARTPTPTLLNAIIVTKGAGALPPTWTPEASATSAFKATGTTLPPVPAGLPGVLVGITGAQLTLDFLLPVFTIKPDGTEFTKVTDDTGRGDYAIITSDGKIIYTYLAGGTDSRLLRLINLNGSQPREISAAWGGQPPLFNQRMPSLGGEGRYLAFAGQNVIGNERFTAIYVVDLAKFLGLNTIVASSTPTILPTDPASPPPPKVITSTPIILPTKKGQPTKAPPPTKIPPTAVAPTAVPPTATTIPLDFYLVRVTPKDFGENNWPNISRDGRFVVFVSDGSALGKDGTDIYYAPVARDAKPSPITSDGSALTEGSPALSPDGKRIVFSAGPGADAATRKNDLYVMALDGAGRTTLAHVDGANNTRPHWSPDGKWIAFTSDRTGKSEIFIVNVDSKQVYQVTNTPNPTFLTDWGETR